MRVADEAPAQLASTDPGSAMAGSIEIQVGAMTVRVTGALDAGLLRGVLGVLRTLA